MATPVSGRFSPVPRRLAGRSPAELAGRGAQAMRKVLERAGLGPTGRRVAGRIPEPRLPFPLPAPDQLAAVYAARPLERRALLERAEKLLHGEFSLLGFPELRFGTPLEWHFDPIRNRRAPLVHWSRVPYLDERVVGDHKIIWELNRMQWLVTLAQAWRLTGEARFLDAIAARFEEWLAANPPRRGINWASSLELAFRAIAWTWTLYLCGEELPDRAGLHGRLMQSLELHGLQIERYLSTWFAPNTHLTGEALGLLYLGVAWPGFRSASRWRKHGWRILLEQLPVQVRGDGTYFEQATWYQAYTADFYLHGLSLAACAGESVPDWAKARITRAVEVVCELLQADGSLPLIGDDDGGRLLPLGPYPPTDFRDSAALGAATLQRPDLCSSHQAPAASVWLIGTERWRHLDGLERQSRAETSRAFEEGGLYLLRGPEGCLTFDAGPHSGKAGGHAHADALSVVVELGGRPVIVDCGTGAYVGPWREHFRAGPAHNTLSLADGTGSATSAGPFRWERWPEVKAVHWSAGPGWALVGGEHDGFSPGRPGCRHQRIVIFRAGWGWLVLDRLSGGEAATFRLHLARELDVVVEGDVATALLRGEGIPVACVVADGAGQLSCEEGLESRCYGTAEPIAVVERRLAAADAAAGVATLLSSHGATSLRREAAPGEVRWVWEAGSDVAVVAWRERQLRYESRELTLTLN